MCRWNSDSAHEQIEARLVPNLLDLSIQELHPDDSLEFLVECSDVVSEHATSAEAVQDNLSKIIFQLQVNELISDVDPILVGDRDPAGYLGHPMLRHVDRHNFKSGFLKWHSQDH